MNRINDREIHHIVMGQERRFRCVEYHTEKSVVLLSEHRIQPTTIDDHEAECITACVSEYMDKLLLQKLETGKRCFAGSSNFNPPRFAEYEKVQNGIAMHSLGQMTLEQFMEGQL